MLRRDTYLVVLPDAAPFIAELCDDDDQVQEASNPAARFEN